MKILLFNSFYYPNIIGGAEISVQILAESLVKLGHRVTVVCLHSRRHNSIDTINGVKVYYIKLRNLYWPYSQHFKLLRPFWHLLDIRNPLMKRPVESIIEMEKPDIVHTNNLSGFSIVPWNIAKFNNVPIVHTIRDHYLLCFRSTMYLRNRICTSQCFECRFYGFYKKQVSATIDAVVGISPYISNKHFEFGYFKRTKYKYVIPNAYRAPKVGEKIKSEIIRFGYIGRLYPSKGIEMALSVFSKLKNQNYEFIIAGSGHPEYENHLIEKYQTSKIRFIGFTNPEDYFSQIDVNIVPSLLNEAFGRTVIEAFAHGIPVIGSDKGGIPDLIDEGRTGFIFKAEQPDDLLRIVHRIIEQPEILKNMDKLTISFSQDYLPENIANQYVSVYRNLIA